MPAGVQYGYTNREGENMTTATTTTADTATMASHNGHTMTYTVQGDHGHFDCTCGFSTNDGFYGHYHMRDGMVPTA
jgi:hypothetical protein